MNRTFVGSTIANDPHTQGLHIASKVAKLAGINSVLLPPSATHEPLLESVLRNDPRYLGLSYRLSPEVGVRELTRALFALRNAGLLFGSSGEPRRIAFSGLPETVAMVSAQLSGLPCPLTLMKPLPEPIDRIDSMLSFFEVTKDRVVIRESLRQEIYPPGISALDHLANEVIAGDRYRDEPPLEVPTSGAITDYTLRMREAGRPVIRSHFGIPAPTIEPTVDGIAVIAEARVIDEVSLGSSDLSQRYFGTPEAFARHKNDGGVPYQTEQDLARLFQATRRGNYPSLKPYAHVVDLVRFIDTCIRNGLLVGAHQAIPLYWFNELDGRGPTPVPDSIREHCEAVRELARRGIPVEMNDPNQWSSRWAHDTVVVASYGMVASVMGVNGVRDLVLQMQFNKPRETGDFADLAKMTAGIEIAQQLVSSVRPTPRVWRETRTGIESLSPNLQKAKWQLARSTLLQLMVEPHILHLVSYCEANYPARPMDIIDGSRLIRRAVRVFDAHRPELVAHLGDPVVAERRQYLVSEARYLLREVARLNRGYKERPFRGLARYLADPDTIAASISSGLMAAPGIVHPTYKRQHLATRPTHYGFIDCVDVETGLVVLTERQRLAGLVGGT